MHLKLSKVISIERLNLSSLGTSEASSKTGWRKSTNSSVESLKFYSSFSQLFVLRNNEITVQNFEIASKSNEKLLDSEQINRLISHKSSITCLGLDENYGLVCSCSDDEVYLWKYNLKTKSWDNCKIGLDFGKISCCSISRGDREILVNLVGTCEIIMLKCSSSDVIDLESKLSITTIDMLASIECSRLQINWIRSFYQNGRLFIVCISSGNSISFRIWEIAANNVSKLIDQKTNLLFKSWASIDFIPYEDFHMILIISPEGWTEIYRVTCDGFVFITNFKIEESNQSSDSSPSSLQMDFRIFAARFLDQNEIQNFYDEQSDQCEGSFISDVNNNSTFCEIERPDSKRNSSLSKWNISTDSEENVVKDVNVNHGWLKNLECFPEEANSCSINFQPQIMDIQISPKLLFCTISNRNISFYNALSGEVEYTLNFKDLVKEDIVVNCAKISISGNEIVCSIQPFFQKRFLTIRFRIDFYPDEEKHCFILSHPIDPKSVLMKNLKISVSDDVNVSPVQTRSKFKITSQYSQASLQGPEYLRAKSKPKRPAFVVSSTPRGSRDESPNNYIPIIRSVKIQQPRTNYFQESLKFSDKNHYDLSKRLSDNLSYIRLAISKDGSFLAGGGSNSPFLVMKTRPIFDSFQTYKDFGRVACTNFSFCTKYLLVGTNDCRSSLLDILSGKKLLDFDFTSKFNEHVDVQFYFLDKFVLQPEANRLSLYSYHLGIGSNNGSHKKLLAGSYTFDLQSITAVSAPNQFYSNLVLCAGSNKTLSVLDQNQEKLVLTIPSAHTKPISCIRINEAPKSFNSLRITDFFLTSAPTPVEPIKFWDLRLGKCVSRVTDINPSIFLPTSRPSLSPSGLYIASGCEENSLIIYDIRKINSRVTTVKTPTPVIGNTAGGLRERGSDILDCIFDPFSPMVWCGCRNGNLYNYFAS